jgi:hypothetical protein
MRQWMNLLEYGEIPEFDRAKIGELVYDDYDWSGGSADYPISVYCKEHDIDFDHDHDHGELKNSVDIRSTDFKEWFYDWVESEFGDEAEYGIAEQIHGEVITLYRCITAPLDWTPDLQHPGIYWSWDEDAADAHWGSHGDGDVEWKMVGEVSVHDVQWEVTFAMNCNPDYNHEKEVRIKDNAPVKIVKYYHD